MDVLIMRRERVQILQKELAQLEREAAELRALIKDEQSHIEWLERRKK